MTVLGHWMLILTLFATGASTWMYYRATSMGRPDLKIPRRLLTLGTLSVSLASALLLLAILRHDFSN